MMEVSIIINGVRYDAVEDLLSSSNDKCDLFDKEKRCKACLIGMNTCERLIGIDGIFKKSTKSFER